jgi:hypothetical protein
MTAFVHFDAGWFVVDESAVRWPPMADAQLAPPFVLMITTPVSPILPTAKTVCEPFASVIISKIPIPTPLVLMSELAAVPILARLLQFATQAQVAPPSVERAIPPFFVSVEYQSPEVENQR